MLILGPKGFRKTPCGDEAAFSPQEGRHFLKLHAEFVPAFLQLFSTPFITSLSKMNAYCPKGVRFWERWRIYIKIATAMWNRVEAERWVEPSATRIACYELNSNRLLTQPKTDFHHICSKSVSSDVLIDPEGSRRVWGISFPVSLCPFNSSVVTWCIMAESAGIRTVT